MRTSLRGLGSRVVRLRKRLRPSGNDVARQLRMMSNEELHCQIIRLARRSGVPELAIAQTAPEPESWRRLMAAMQRLRKGNDVSA